AHQARIAHHIGGEDRGETAGGGSRCGHGWGGDNSRAEFSLLRAGTRPFHVIAAPTLGSPNLPPAATTGIMANCNAGHPTGIPALRSPAKKWHRARLRERPSHSWVAIAW
ncbi:MAG TPA: hypothetical protein VKG22_10345, partial [Stellaceae bacterium]|nr:hypothetical protein [Stellaceae bacterium]